MIEDFDKEFTFVYNSLMQDNTYEDNIKEMIDKEKKFIFSLKNIQKV